MHGGDNGELPRKASDKDVSLEPKYIFEMTYDEV
jgi:hypothetical protein